MKQMTSRLGNETTSHEGTFDCPQQVLGELKQDISSIRNAFPHTSITKLGTHTHDRGHVLVVFQVTSKKPFDKTVDEICDYLDSYAHHLYANFRNLDASRWQVLPYPSL